MYRVWYSPWFQASTGGLGYNMEMVAKGNGEREKGGERGMFGALTDSCHTK